jgi:hypothetical protein
MSDDEIDIDNMDFDLPTELVNAPAVPQAIVPQNPLGADNPFAALMEDMTPQLKFKPAEMSEKDVEITKR